MDDDAHQGLEPAGATGARLPSFEQGDVTEIGENVRELV
jgi:hypothetical protein